ncbi:MAG: beta strand repeat-containing protein [Gemmataceae bacterium]
MFTRRTRPTSFRRKITTAPRARLFLNPLESREVPAIFSVTNLFDGAVAGPGQLPGSLRQAIYDANAAGTDDVIDLTAVSGTLNMSAGVGNFVISGNTTLTGPGAGLLTIKGAGDSRIFFVSDETNSSIKVSMSGMTLTGGMPNEATPVNAENRSGGAIFCRNEVLTLDSMVITGNRTPTQTLDNATVFSSGGAIAMSMGGRGGSLTISNCQIDSNTAGTFIPGVIGAGNGGAISFGFPSTKTNGGFDNNFYMINSTVSGNVSAARGGGIYFTHYNGYTNNFLMVNSTVSSNLAQNEFGGGVVISGTTTSNLNIVDSTIANNTAQSWLGGGGLALNSGAGVMNIDNSIIADNVGNSQSSVGLFAQDIYSNGTTVAARNSVLSSSVGFNFNTNTNNTFASAQLAPLAVNGNGFLKTHLLKSSSPAIDIGAAAVANFTTISTAVTNSTITFVTVASAASIAIGEQFQIDAEIMTVTGINASTITVTRGASGSTAAAHSSGAAVKPVVSQLTTVGAASITSSATTINVSSSVGLTNGMPLQIESEIVWINAAVGSNTITVVRGKNGTSAATHATGVSIRSVPVTLANLNAAIGSTTATTMTVFNAAKLAPGLFVQLDAEIVKVTAVSGTTVTIARGQNGSTAAAHTVVFTPVTLPYDQRGNTYSRSMTGISGTRVDAGAVEYTPAAVTGIVTGVTTATGADSTITVVFTAASPATVDTTTLNNVLVRYPDGSTTIATAPITNSGTASAVTATYTIAAPGGGWDYADNGRYTIEVVPNAVKDSAAVPLNTTAIGQFNVAIGRTLTVDNNGDSDDSVYTAGNLTLREAVLLANANFGANGVTDTIAFDTSSAGLGSNPTISIGSELRVADSTVINPASASVTLDGGGISRIFNIMGQGIITVTLNGLTLTNGFVGYPYSGGAMVVDAENVSLTDCTISNSQAPFGSGGGIFASGVGQGILNLSRVTMTGNKNSALSLGGVLSSNEVNIIDSTFINNSGAGVAAGNGSLRIYSSTFTGNSAGINVGGALSGNGLLIRNTTVSGNAGAGINLNVSATYGTQAIIANSTITRNTSSSAGGGIAVSQFTTASLQLQNSIVAENSAPSYGWDLYSLGTSSVLGFTGNFNVIGILDSTSKVTGTGNQSGSFQNPLNPMLQPLANNGGLTQTHLPYSGSPEQDYSVFAANDASSMSLTTTTFNNTTTTFSGHNEEFIRIDNEIMRIVGAGSVSPFTVTVDRAVNGSIATTHASGAPVYFVPQPRLAKVGSFDSSTTTLGIVDSTQTQQNIAVGSYITADSEIMKVTAVTTSTTGATITVLRGQLSTTAVSHTNTNGVVLFQTYDQRGPTAYARTRGSSLEAGAVEIDPNIPFAKMTYWTTVTSPGATPNMIVVTYTDDVAINGTTIDTGNIKIDPPSGPQIIPTYLASSPDKSSTTSALTYSVTYTFTPPVNSAVDWDSSDNGNYSVVVDPPTDTSGNPVQTHQIGQIRAAITNTLIVTNTNDLGVGSLRDAIYQSNASPGAHDTIIFDTTVFNTATPQTISLIYGELLITDAVTITGPGAAAVTITGYNAFRVFTIDTPSTAQDITMSGMTVTGGNGFGTVDSFSGGGGILDQDEALTLDSMVITGNSVTATSLNQGGGILLNGLTSSLTLRNSTLSNNSSVGNGGGLEVRYVNNIINIQNCTISGNKTGNGGSGAGLDFTQQSVGAIVNPCTVTIDNSTFNDNVAGSAGGAIRTGSGSGTGRVAKFAITNSTFNNNVSYTTGGAISVGSPIEFTLLSSTISGNYALQGGGGIAAATTASLYTAMNVAIVNSVISGNGNKFWPDILFGGTSIGISNTPINISVVNSFIGAVDSATLNRLDNQGSNIGTIASPLDAKLGPLAFHGGTVKTMMPLPGSPLINTGSGSPTVRVMKAVGPTSASSASTTVGATSITTSATTIGVTSATGIAVGTEINIDSEYMFVIGVSGTTLTVIRGTGTSSSGSGSSAAAHAAGAQVNFDNGIRVNVPYFYVGLPLQVDSEVMTVVQVNGNGVTTLSQASGIGTGDTTFTLASTSGIPNPTIGFNGQLVLDPGTASAETVTITALSSGTITVTRGGTPYAHAFGSTISNLSSPLLVNRAQANTAAAAHSAGASVNRAAVRFLGFLSTGGMDAVSSPITVNVSDSRWMFAGMTIQIDSEIMTVTAVPTTTSVTVTRTAPVAHVANAIISRPFLSTDARGLPRQVGTIDIGAVEVDPTAPTPQATFADITTAGASSYSFNVVYTDDVNLDTASFNSTNVKVTAPDGVTTIAVTYNPGDYTIGAGSATVKYSIPAFGGPTWQSSADGFYDISIKSGTQVTDTSANPVFASSLDSLHVAISKSIVVDNTGNDDDGITTVGQMTLREAIRLANSNVGVVDVISFDTSVTSPFNTPQTIFLTTGQLQITDPVTITGPGAANVTVDAGLQFRVLDIKLSPQYWTSTVTLTGMTLANGRVTTSPLGAGIADEAGALVMDSITMSGNSCSSSGGALDLLSYYSPLTISNSTFTNNIAFLGSAIYVGNNGSGVNAVSGQTNYPTNMLVSITNTTFDGNSGSGAGIVRIDSGAIATISNSSFTNNTFTSSTGGAIGVSGASVTVTNTTISNNFGISSSGNNGSGLYFLGAATATISNSNISSNTAGIVGTGNGNGAGVFVTGTASVTLNNDTINNNVSNSSATTGGGGGLFMSGTTATVTINNSNLNNNQTWNNGGGVFVSGGSLTINNSTVNNNNATSPYNFAASTVGQGGGGMFITGSATVTVNSSTLANNTAMLNGGGIMASLLTTAATASGTIYVNNSTLSGNTAQSIDPNSGGGGVIISGTGGMMLLTNTTISGNSAVSLGGGLLAGVVASGTTVGFTGSLAVRNSTIASNTAGGGGGGMNFNIASSATSITLMSTIVSNNISTTAGTGNDLRTGSASTKFNTANTLVGDTNDFGAGTVTGTLVAGPASLAALGNYGGPTQTHKLNVGSTAISAGSSATNLLTAVGATSVAIGATTIQVTDTSKLSVGTRLQIDSEIMTISSISSTTITVNRAQQGTIAAIHASGANVSFPSLLPATDQRGAGYVRSFNATDIGAFEVQAPPTVTGVVWGDGTNQRSTVRRIVVTFSEPVTFMGDVTSAFTVHRTGTAGTVGDVALTAVPAIGSTNSVTITFSGGLTESAGSLVDGLYDLIIGAAFVSGEGGALDGNGDQIAGGDYNVVGTTANKHYRYFGDENGDGTTDQTDYLVFRNAIGTLGNTIFDFNNDNQVDQNDYLEFRNRIAGAP